MAKILWDQVGERLYETGVDQGVLYPYGSNGYEKGVAWNGLTTVNENSEGGEPSAIYADNIKYLNLVSAEDANGSIEAYTYPDEFNACMGITEVAGGVTIAQQSRKMFGFCYRTRIGNDVVGDSLGYKIHIIYGALASPSEKSYATVNDSPEAMTLSWDFSTTPILVGEGFKPTARLIIDTTKISTDAKKAIEAALYGVDADPEATPPVAASDPTLLTPAEIIAIIEQYPVQG